MDQKKNMHPHNTQQWFKPSLSRHLGDVVALRNDADDSFVCVGHGQGPDVVRREALHGLVDRRLLRDAEIDLEVT